MQEFTSNPSAYNLEDLVRELKAYDPHGPGENALKLQYENAIFRGASVKDLRSELGLLTSLSPEDASLSRRADLYRRFPNAFGYDGTTRNSEVQTECLLLHQQALQRFIEFFPFNETAYGINLHSEVKNIGGSYVGGHPRIGIHKPGMTFVIAHEAQIMSGAIKRHGMPSYTGIVVPSDIDLQVGIAYSHWDQPHGRELNERIDGIRRAITHCSKEIFEEYGVFIHWERWRIDNGVPLDQFLAQGGFSKYNQLGDGKQS